MTGLSGKAGLHLRKTKGKDRLSGRKAHRADRKAMDSTLEKIQRRLMSPEVKKAAKEQIKEKAQPSVLGMIERFKADIKREDEEKAKRKEELNKKQNRER